MNTRTHIFLSLQFFAVLFLFSIAIALLYYSGIEKSYEQYANAMVIPKQYLHAQAEAKGLDYALLNKIVECESGWRMVPNAKSSAYGYFQILDKTEQSTPQYKNGQRKIDPLTNIDMGIYLFERYGTSPWLESYNCWKGYSN